MCVRARRFRKKEKGSPRKPRERENIEYKISYFIINIPFSVSSVFILPVCFVRGTTPGELALIGWKIFQPIRFSCTNTIKSGGGRKTYYRGPGRQDNRRKEKRIPFFMSRTKAGETFHKIWIANKRKPDRQQALLPNFPRCVSEHPSKLKCVDSVRACGRPLADSESIKNSRPWFT